MFLFYWFHVFDDAYRNGFADGFSIGFACFIGIAAYRCFVRFRNRRRIAGFTADPVSGLLVDRSETNFYCPFCAAADKISRMIRVDGELVCPKCRHIHRDPLRDFFDRHLSPR